MSNRNLTARGRRNRSALINAAQRQADQVRLASYPAGVKNKSFLAGLVTSLGDFGAAQMRFFADGFATNSLGTKDAPPEAYVLSVITRQIAHDLSVIERAIDQRRDGVEKRKILEQADVITTAALHRAEPFLAHKVWPVTYLHKSPVIRVIPYAPAALIGIPYTAMDAVDDQGKRTSDNRDYLAIAHEVGHYVYWHGRYGDTNWDSKKSFVEGLTSALGRIFDTGDLDRNKPLYAHWLEEIFADVFAAMVGGTATSLSIQDVVSDNLPKRMTEDDGEHPFAVLRPYIYTQVLRHMGFNEAATELEQKWGKSPAYTRVSQYLLKASQVNPGIRRYDKNYEQVGQEKGKSLDDVKVDLQTIAVRIWDALQIDTASKETVWTNEAATNEIYGVFSDRVDNDELFSKSKLDNIEWPTYGESDNQEMGEWQAQGGPIHLPILETLKVKKEEIEGGAGPIPFANWKSVFQVSGWSSGGGDDAYPN